MGTLTLADIERAIRDSWSCETTFLDKSGPSWRVQNPSHGQCGTTALVVQDLLGGDLLIADVTGGCPGVGLWTSWRRSI
jgi:hypothetical protein